MPAMARNRPVTYIAIIAAFIFFYSYLLFPSSPSSSASPYNAPEQGYSSAKGRHGSNDDDTEKTAKGAGGLGLPHISSETIHGEVIMPKLGNETLNASHFRLLLQKYPPQTSSRGAASQWGCVVHNAVNDRLGKEIFDCGTIADKYHCGCAEEDEKKRKEAEEAEAELVKASGASSSSKNKKKKQKIIDDDEEGEMKLVKEGLTRGG
ncbi:hypothetical protein ABW20_dc0108333 [Dactylellina cionopaga]|nr:hypothetical protein ABW20_dc0108333 [Dactylellina cionopaga]